jgi:hypothetical protein
MQAQIRTYILVCVFVCVCVCYLQLSRMKIPNLFYKNYSKAYNFEALRSPDIYIYIYLCVENSAWTTF